MDWNYFVAKISEAVRVAFSGLRSENPGKHFYAVAHYTAADYDTIAMAANTTEDFNSIISDLGVLSAAESNYY